MKVILSLTLIFLSSLSWAVDLESWNDGATKQNILNYVKDTTTVGNEYFIPKEERIAVFNNDGTLWAEQPVPVELQFTVDSIKKMAPQHPDWKTAQPFKAILENDHDLSQLDDTSISQLVAITFVGMTDGEYMKNVQDWLKTAKDEKTGLSYTQRVYQPMLELLQYLRAHDFKTYIVTGGSRDFIRVFAEQVYGIPPEQVIGTTVQKKLLFVNGRAVFFRENTVVAPADVGEGKAINIERQIGRIPVFAVGNRDVDTHMLNYTSASPRLSLEMILKHDDDQREYSYNKGAERIQSMAKKSDWLITSMKNEFKLMFAK